ncbi:MAG: hypothetical protein ACRDM7_03940 [Thermoleophilaceae bacterium]
MTGPSETTPPSTGEATASGQAPADRGLPAVIPPTPGEGLAGFELPESMRAAAESGLRGIALLVATNWVDQQTKEMAALREENRALRKTNEHLAGDLAEARQDNAVLRERLTTRWSTQATGQIGAISLGAGLTMYGVDTRMAVILTVIGVILLVISWRDLRRPA